MRLRFAFKGVQQPTLGACKKLCRIEQENDAPFSSEIDHAMNQPRDVACKLGRDFYRVGRCPEHLRNAIDDEAGAETKGGGCTL